MTNEHEHGHKKTHTFFVDNKKYETTKSTLTGAEIKAMIPDFDPNYSLFLENPGDDPDELIQDSTSVSLDTEKGPRRFYTVPPANFG
jgi:hypothetical protein